MFWGYLVTFIMTMIISFSMAEICSAYPSAGSVYHWSAQLVPASQAPLASYICGWFNFIGNAAGDAAFANSFATIMNAAIQASNPDAAYDQNALVGVSLAVIVLWSILNVLRIDEVSFINYFAVLCQGGGVIIIVCALLSLPDRLASDSFVFTKYENESGFDDENQKSYVVCIGLLTSLFSFAGYEASAHMAEETHGSTVSAPKGIIFTCFATGLSGLALILAFLYATTDIDAVENGDTDSETVNLFVLACGSAWGQGLAWIVVINLFLAGISSVAVTGRITYALMRDKAFAYSEFWGAVHPYFQTPVNAIFFVCMFDMLIQLLPLIPNGGDTAFNSIVSLSTISFQVSYGMPILLKLIYQPKSFPMTSMSLGVWSIPCGIASCLWLFGTACFLFFPTEAPVVESTMNWVIVVLAGCVIILAINWVVNSQYTFTGPRRHEDLGDETGNNNSGSVSGSGNGRESAVSESELVANPLNDGTKQTNRIYIVKRPEYKLIV